MTPALFAQSVLASLSLPVTDNNIAALVAIQAQEGGHEHNSAAFNPLNTGYDVPGSRSAGLQVKSIKAYSSWEDGIRATAKTIAQGNMKSIYQALSRSAPPEETLAVFAASPWGWYKYEHGVRVQLPYPGALSLVRNPAQLAKYANTAYSGALGMAGGVWHGLSVEVGGLPIWSAALLCGATAILGSQLWRHRPALGGVFGAGVGLVGFFVIGKSRQA